MFCQEYTHKHTHIYVDTRTYTQTDRQKSAQTSPPFPGTQTLPEQRRKPAAKKSNAPLIRRALRPERASPPRPHPKSHDQQRPRTRRELRSPRAGVEYVLDSPYRYIKGEGQERRRTTEREKKREADTGGVRGVSNFPTPSNPFTGLIKT